MAGDHPDALAYRRTADAFRAGDFGALEGLIAPDVVWHVPGEHRMAGDLRGRDAILAWLAELKALGFWLEEHDVFASDQHVCAVSTMGARRDRLDVQTRVVSIFRYRHRQQVERWLYPDDQTAWDSIFGR
ncbi:MAG TPA: nuclear transport factor 2 family protein [Gaiellales bacterium]|nr:nuclear transport factor 2 family protein [Gaiellales bacterium]